MNFLVLLLIPVLGFAQQLDEQVVVFSKYNEAYKGVIINENRFEITMVLDNGDTTYIERGMYKYRKNLKDVKVFDNGKYHKTVGLFFNMEYSSNVGTANISKSFDFIFGKRINPKINLGIGYGWSWHSTSAIGNIYVDNYFRNVFLYGRYNLNQSQMKLFLVSGLGFASARQAWNSEFSEGLFFKPGIGIEFASRRKKRIYFKLSQHLQKVEGTKKICCDDLEYKYTHILNRTQVSIGVHF